MQSLASMEIIQSVTSLDIVQFLTSLDIVHSYKYRLQVPHQSGVLKWILYSFSSVWKFV